MFAADIVTDAKAILLNVSFFPRFAEATSLNGFLFISVTRALIVIRAVSIGTASSG